jgi:hypothetical protein
VLAVLLPAASLAVGTTDYIEPIDLMLGNQCNQYTGEKVLVHSLVQDRGAGTELNEPLTKINDAFLGLCRHISLHGVVCLRCLTGDSAQCRYVCFVQCFWRQVCKQLRSKRIIKRVGK